MNSRSIGSINIVGIYNRGHIISDDCSITVSPAIASPYVGRCYFMGTIYMDELDRPYIDVLNFNPIPDSLPYNETVIYTLLKPYNPATKIQLLELESGLKMYVDFSEVSEIKQATYYCSLRYKRGTWYLVPKGCGK